MQGHNTVAEFKNLKRSREELKKKAITLFCEKCWGHMISTGYNWKSENFKEVN